MRLNQVNKVRELLNYDYTHLYNTVKHPSIARQGHLHPRRKQIKEEKIGADLAEYGVMVEGKMWKFSSFEKCVEEAAKRGGTVLRLGRNSGKAFDVMNVAAAYDAPEKKFLARTDESGNIEPPEAEEIIVDSSVNQRISEELLIYCKGTRPPADVLLAIHQRHPDISFYSFAVAVLSHCELSPPSESGRLGHHKTGSFRSYEEKELWYSTPAGKAWVKENPVPAIMQHTMEEFIEWKNTQ